MDSHPKLVHIAAKLVNEVKRHEEQSTEQQSARSFDFFLGVDVIHRSFFWADLIEA